MTYAEFVKSIKSTVYPDREAQNLAAIHTKYVLDGLIEVQKRVPELRQCNTDKFPFEDTFFNCKASTIRKPDGPVLRAYTTKKKDGCDRVYYKPTTKEHMEALLEQARNGCCYPPSMMPVPFTSTQVQTETKGTPAPNDFRDLGSITVTPPVIQGGRPGVFTVKIEVPAPEAGVTLAITTDPPGVIIGLPATVTIPKGEKSADMDFDSILAEETVMVTFGALLSSAGGSTGKYLQIAVIPWDSTDKGWRACHGYYAVICDQLFLFPNIESTEALHIEWQGIKTSYNQNDEIEVDRDVQSVIELYVQAQTALREDCDINKYTSLQTFWSNAAAQLRWWYRTKRLLPEAPWRAIMCKTCDEPEIEITGGGGGGGGPSPPGNTFTLYLGNGGSDFNKASYSESELTSLDNTISNSISKSILAGDYDIAAPSSGLNEFRVIAFPQSVHMGTVEFKNSGFILPMNELPVTSISGTSYRVFRTTSPSDGNMTSALGNPITIIPK